MLRLLVRVVCHQLPGALGRSPLAETFSRHSFGPEVQKLAAPWSARRKAVQTDANHFGGVWAGQCLVRAWVQACMVLRLEAEELTQYNEDLDADRKRDLLSALISGLDAALPFLHQVHTGLYVGQGM